MASPSPVAVVTGASSGIGAATARALAKAGFHVVAGARRRDRIDALAAEIGATPITLDVTDQASVDALANQWDQVAVLVNNAGGASGLEPVAEADLDRWRWMYDTNVLGALRMTRALLPALRAGEGGHLVFIDSVAAYEVYEGGAGYTGAKHAESAMVRTLRLELLGQPVKVTEINPGMVDTEFSLIRFDGDTQRAHNVYAGLTPLTAEDVAEVVAFAVTRPAHVNLDRIDLKPLDQATATKAFRRQ